MSPKIDDEELDKKLTGCEVALEYQFENRSLLHRCLTHASVSKTRLASNERLEFLGDAILGMVVCEMLFHQLPEESEGELTRIKSIVVSRNTCAKLSRQMELQNFVLLGKGLSAHENIPESILADVFESLIAGIYLDGGMTSAREFILRMLDQDIQAATESRYGRNYKSLLQQVAQKSFTETPVYQLLDEKGPDHSKCFKMSAVIGTRSYSAAWGNNKKEAEQRAAHNALNELEGEVPPYTAD